MPGRTAEVSQFLQDKYIAIRLAYGSIQESRMNGDDLWQPSHGGAQGHAGVLQRGQAGPGPTVWQTRRLREMRLQINILEAVEVDREQVSNIDNARVGLALAHYVQGRGRDVAVRESGSGNREFRFAVGEHWVHTYAGWNAAFVVGLGSTASGAGINFIPSVHCLDKSFEAQHWASARTTSLFLRLIVRSTSTATILFNATAHRLALAWGHRNYASMLVASPSASELEHMVSDFPNTSSLYVLMGPYLWVVVIGVTLSLVSVLLGFGMEWFVLTTLFATPHPATSPKRAAAVPSHSAASPMTASASLHVEHGKGRGVALRLSPHCESHKHCFHRSQPRVARALEGGWVLAQLAFGFLVAIGVFSGSPLGLIPLVIGLWKLGFPETITNFVYGVAECDWTGRPRHIIDCVTDVGASIGEVLHHQAVIWFAICHITGLENVNEYWMHAGCVPLILQHLVAGLRLRSFATYVVLELGLEIWWEVEAFSNFDKLQWFHTKRVFNAMLLAHWLYWLCGTIEVCRGVYASGGLSEFTSESTSERMLHRFHFVGQGMVRGYSTPLAPPDVPVAPLQASGGGSDALVGRSQVGDLGGATLNALAVPTPPFVGVGVGAQSPVVGPPPESVHAAPPAESQPADAACVVHAAHAV